MEYLDTNIFHLFINREGWIQAIFGADLGRIKLESSGQKNMNWRYTK